MRSHGFTGRMGRAALRRVPCGCPIVALGLLIGLAAAQAQPARRSRTASDCGPTAQRTERLVAVDPRGDLVFQSGLRGRVAGLRLVDPAPGAPDARTALARFVGRDLSVTVRGEPDRWGRSALDAVAGSVADEPGDLAGSLVLQGLAAVDAGEDDALCRPALLALEATARGAGRGLWAASPVIEARDAAGLSAALGRFVVAEGRVRSIGERRSRTYLNFAAPGEQGLTITMLRRTWRRLAERGLDARSLRGRRVRARGVLETWRGPTLDMAASEVLEVLDEEQARRR